MGWRCTVAIVPLTSEHILGHHLISPTPSHSTTPCPKVTQSFSGEVMDLYCIGLEILPKDISDTLSIFNSSASVTVSEAYVMENSNQQLPPRTHGTTVECL